MKKLLLTIAALGALTFTAVAQDASKTAAATELTPDQKAENETKKATAALGLTDAQKVKFKQFSVERINANKPLREKAKASADKTEKQTLHAQVKANNEKYFNNVNAILTAEQQPKWAEHRKKVEANHKAKASQQD